MDRKKGEESVEIRLCSVTFLIIPMAVYYHLPAAHCRAGAGCRRVCLPVALPELHLPAVT